jgi:L-lactate dehydrogenase complex protein LldF
MKPTVDRFPELVKENLAHTVQRTVLQQFSSILRLLRDSAFSRLPDPDGAIERSREIRRHALNHMPGLLEEFECKAESVGAHVVWARDAAEANAFITSLARARGAHLCVKGKSMITEETGLREAMGREGIETWETDLGEFIVQLAGRTPFHTVGPSINMTASEISGLFHEKIGSPRTEVPNELGRYARLYLRDKFERAEIGISGANMLIADTGTVLLVENEGNVRLCTSAPRVHVAVASIEKVVPTIEAAFDVLKVLTRSCTGQHLSQYVSLITGPRRTGEADGPEELYIVIVDNGRSAIYADPAVRSALQCIRCGYCSAVCPVYGRIGGYAYGWVYSGPIGAVLNPLLLGRRSASHLYRATSLCGACKRYCPGGVDLTGIFLELRRRGMDGPGRSFAEMLSFKRIFYAVFSGAISGEWRYRMAAGVLRVVMRPFSRDGIIARGLAGLSGWTRYRKAPGMADVPFRNTIDARTGSVNDNEK